MVFFFKQVNYKGEISLDVNQVIYTIAKKVDLYQFSLDHSDRSAHTIAPLFQKEFGNNYRLLKEAIIKIEKNDLIPGLIFTDYPGSSTIVGLDVTNAVMSEYATRLANTHPLKIKLKSFIGKLENALDEHKAKVNSRVQHYDKYSNEQLLAIVQRGQFHSVQDRIALVSILKRRGIKIEQ